MSPRNGNQIGRRKKEDFQGDESSLGSDGLENETDAIKWLHLTPRVAALGTDAFERSPVMIRKIHDYLVKEVNLAKNAEEKSAEFVNRVCQVTLEAFWHRMLRERKALTGLTACWKGWEPDGPRPSKRKFTHRFLDT